MSKESIIAFSQMLISIVQQSFMYQIMLKLTCQLKAIFTKMELQMFHLTNTF